LPQSMIQDTDYLSCFKEKHKNSYHNIMSRLYP
jgi:hypothetical protein